MGTILQRLRPLLLLAVALAVGCRGRETGRGNDTAGEVPSLPRPLEPGRTATIAWDTTAGFYFAVPADRPAQAFLIDALYTSSSQLDTLQIDPVRLQDLTLDLLSGGGVVGTARIAEVTQDSTEHCADWPLVQLAPVPSPSVIGGWKVAFTTGRVRAVVFDSLPSLSSADSVQRVVAIARAASVVGGDTALAFRGRPFVVRQANRVAFGDRDVVLAEVVRTVQQEANPQQEQLLLVLDGGDSVREGQDARYGARYHDRTIALEEAIESVELIAALRVVNTGTPMLLLRREGETGTAFVLLQRGSDGAWFARWRSATSGC